MMGRQLTVESRLKSYQDSIMPLLVTKHYTESAYQRMLIKLGDILIQNNEPAYYYQFISDQSRTYLTSQMIIKGLEASCRYFRP
jgi:FMN-dependent NADH-azoreductase